MSDSTYVCTCGNDRFRVVSEMQAVEQVALTAEDGVVVDWERCGYEARPLRQTERPRYIECSTCLRRAPVDQSDPLHKGMLSIPREKLLDLFAGRPSMVEVAGRLAELIEADEDEIEHHPAKVTAASYLFGAHPRVTAPRGVEAGPASPTPVPDVPQLSDRAGPR